MIAFGFPEPVEEPEDGVMLNQDCVFEASQLRVPPPEFQTDKVWEGGFGPPTVALKEMLDGLNPIVEAAIMVKFAVTVRLLFMVTVAVDPLLESTPIQELKV